VLLLSEAFYNSYAQLLLSEELTDCAFQNRGPDSESKLFMQAICSFVPEFPIESTCEVTSRIDSILPGVHGIAFSCDALRTVLAIFRSERNQYFMRREAVLIGRGTLDHDVDIDLTFESDRTCTHISRMQAIVSFLEDNRFYLENVGHRVLRVNGVTIEPGQMCQLPSGALLDFSGTLLIFIANEAFAKEIHGAVDGTGSSSSKKRSLTQIS
jgi:hypothetical protein